MCTELERVNTPYGGIVFDSFNTGGVVNGAKPTTFKLAVPHLVGNIATYHFNGGLGAEAGTIGLADLNSGEVYCGFDAEIEDGQGGVPANWVAAAGVRLEAGNYAVIDSDSKTWSTNGIAGGRGFVRLFATPELEAGSGSVPVTLGEQRMGICSCIKECGGAVAYDFMVKEAGKPLTVAAWVPNAESLPGLKLFGSGIGTILDTQTAGSNMVQTTVTVPADFDITKPITLTISECRGGSLLQADELAVQVFE